MTYISTHRRHDEDTQYRKENLDKANQYEDKRGAFLSWAKTHGVSEAEIRKGMQELDRMVEHFRHMADQSNIDPTATNV